MQAWGQYALPVTLAQASTCVTDLLMGVAPPSAAFEFTRQSAGRLSHAAAAALTTSGIVAVHNSTCRVLVAKET